MTKEAGQTANETRSYNGHPRINRLLMPIATLAMLLSGCFQAEASIPPKKVNSITATPNFSKLTIGGVSCEGSTPRPCFQPLYKSPTEVRPLTTADILNKFKIINNVTHVLWPYEAYNNPSGGNPVDIVCQIEGTAVHNAYNQSTTVWDVIRVPRSELNEAALVEAEGRNPGFGVEKNKKGYVEAVFADASSQWLGGIHRQLETCTHIENPEGYRPAA